MDIAGLATGQSGRSLLARHMPSSIVRDLTQFCTSAVKSR
jgi:hypothetical protein